MRFETSLLARAARPSLAAALVLVTGAVAGCKKAEAVAESSISSASALPVVTDESKGLLFTWIDEGGEFHTEERAADVGFAGRDIVRVLDPERTPSPDEVIVADLRNKGPQGSYSVRTMGRQAFDELAQERRRRAGKGTLARASASAATGPEGRAAQTAEAPQVILYGASWCGACHEAAAYLKKKGVRFVEKDIEADASAEREMHAKLAKAGVRGGGIPVMDVRGQVMVGFSAPKLEAALASAR